ncbi:tRNA (adenosine(37)-N6)-threonylcarbamoyltransferase complex ATPase subunit type 1 TsaE [Flavobacterium sp.]|uniref:tRNA (adenosine(37)-N6)-threonylcarbamoyltransferase complex ATPase subunit type 1 TsaE n=1 Tax=Flavobacterium sp. TaxID=239 RepID=UPI0026026A53|nr:tRNA (adenosine(37)-N6)-threonylcarbamoyltransferase complex ATPase subunit type 1 TsaE [Flavobacterium sp.]
MTLTFSLDDIHQIAQQILDKKPKKVILFYGEMGAGKTTLIKALTKKLGVDNATSSPTFSLVNEYQTDTEDLVYHFDMYRLKNEHEAYDMGMDEYLYSDHWCFIEWPEKIPTLVPHEHSTVKIKALPNGDRELEFR